MLLPILTGLAIHRASNGKSVVPRFSSPGKIQEKPEFDNYRERSGSAIAGLDAALAAARRDKPVGMNAPASVMGNREMNAGFSQGQGALADAIAMSRKAAAGQTPSVAAMQQKQGFDQSIAQQFALANSQRGGFNPAAVRQAQMQSASLGQGLAAQQALLRAQEIAQARGELGQYGQASGQLGAQIGSIALQDRGQNIEVAQTNLQSTLANRARVDEMVRASAQAKLGSLSSELGAQASIYGAQLGYDGQRFAANQQKEGQLLGGVIGAAGAGAAAMLSDERQKKNISSSDSQMHDFLSALSARQYEYKNPSMQGAAPGKRYGIVAQDLEKSEVGKSMVKDVGGMKMIDTNQGFGAVLGALAHINKKLEKKGG